jgi:voltage-gated potassium channel Kch
MTAADLALGLFACFNSVRILAYVPQIIRIARDRDGARAISYGTWLSFALSHLSTVGYALFVVSDVRMAAIFGANTVACLAILILTIHKRRRNDDFGRPLDAASEALVAKMGA